MNNPMLQMLSKNAQQSPMMGNNPFQIMQQIKSLAGGITPDEAQKRVEEMRKSGKVSDSQFEQAMQLAQQIQSLFNG